MKCGLLTAQIRLEGCRSLKEKRSRMGGLRDRLGKSPLVAIIESDYQDQHQLSEWSVMVLAPNQAKLDQILDQTESRMAALVDGEITGLTIEMIF